MPSPARPDMLRWLKNIWDSFPTEIVNSFTGCGYGYEDGINYGMETESDSD